MPELPEVETIVRDLSKSLEGKIFSDVIVRDDFLLRQRREDFVRRIRKKSVAGISRRGKAVIIGLSCGSFLVIQPMMTGQLVIDGQEDRHSRIVFNFSDGTRLLYNDQRRFGQLRAVDDLKDVPYFNILGPEPFAAQFSPAYMAWAFRRSRRPVKNSLLDHTFVAGIGNIYACEILFRSALAPRRQACRISEEKIKTVHRFIREVLNEAIAHRGSSMRNYRDGRGRKGAFHGRLAVYGREGLPCPRCRRAVKRVIQAGRSTFYCGHCQK
ncbi:MAG: bifunctional DNA-formamidopyrimidine glycosylase/DNA-(apurinic or apyrimidinic site) lyase [Candidatus Omnitrophica bacterium]|nr:bifunctional DNA-formamidopyrimidine glycosylase/DNA-(apurinic or apyrimidinic site) lyase [Candidatus Omnitrophota bacterium]MDE2232109.1 bifunctional DNA-formamidopyrimidine glycosylase/DNA-(apurinic or apyrimidinic site) lyase [Candidatus Omnitrophota bacterium]